MDVGIKNMEEIKTLEKQAIEAAFSNQWEEAIKLNKKILELDKNNLDAILRLGFAYFQKQEFNQAKKIYQKGLKLQPNHPVIINYLQKIDVMFKKRKEKKEKLNPILANPELFLEVPGKTKSVALVNLGQKNILAKLSIGQPVSLFLKRRKIIIKTEKGEFVGNLPDDIGKRMIILIKGGNKYSAFIKEVSLNRVVVFLREENKSKKLKHFISFPSSLTKNFSEIIKEEKMDEEAMESAEEDDFTLDDLEKIAESLGEEKEDYLPFNPSDEDNLEEEE